MGVVFSLSLGWAGLLLLLARPKMFASLEGDFDGSSFIALRGEVALLLWTSWSTLKSRAGEPLLTGVVSASANLWDLLLGLRSLLGLRGETDDLKGDEGLRDAKGLKMEAVRSRDGVGCSTGGRDRAGLLIAT